MKKQLFMHRGKLCLLIAASFSFLSVSASVTDPAKDSVSSAANIRYLGATEHLLTFSVDFLNPEGKPFILEVKNEQNETLYRHSYDTKNFSRKIYLQKTPEQGLVSFGIRMNKEVIKETFSIRPQTKVVENLVVKRL
ncbi:hypothetical protein EXU57_18670 [Segetibacter sp. 3557_3]|uniref:hypothetical protein n=1 Tax=Segetibacter sp. 3557_3 TaxID=2547429 RepID=UPI00105852B9|nr:hypothetical protein [Segetibacter sp. 3557_3]TDH23077.1 hypothetical protein EXU57_18670 [Segetibacter sp. 3557_3]